MRGKLVSKHTINGILEHLRQELILTEVKAREIGSRSDIISIDALQGYVEEQKIPTARDKGITSLIKDRKRVRDSLIFAAVSFIFGGLLTRDKFEALSTGMSGFDGMVQGFGETRWCVLIGKKISVVPEGAISAKVPWITLASFYRAIEELKRRALAGDKLGNLNDVISKLMKICSISNN